MKKRTLCLLLALAMMACLFGGCAKTEEAAQAAAETVTEAASDAAEAVEEAETEAVQELTDSEEAPAEEPKEEAPAEAPAAAIEYPLEDTTLTVWTSFDVNAFSQALASYSELPTLGFVKEKTGISLEFTEVASASATEQYQLMIAAGDYCDIIPTSNYTGGAIQAYADDVIVDLTPYLADCCPDFWAELQTYTAAEQYNGTSDGLYLALPNFVKTVIYDSGAFTRGDWLKDLGLEKPTTFSELENMVYAMHDAYDTDWTIHMESGCSLDYANSWFETGIFTVSGTDIACFEDGGVIRSGMNTDGYRAYLEWLIQLYTDGLLNQDFYVSSLGPDAGMYIGKGEMAYWTAMADHMESYWEYNTDDEDFDVVPLGRIANDDGVVYIEEAAKVEIDGRGGNPSISCDCESVETALQFMNWFYTAEGIDFANYGQEGVSFNLDENGNKVYTDVILNNPSGCNSLTAFKVYGWNLTGSAYYNTRYIETYTDRIREAIELWTDVSGVTYGQYIPAGAGLSTEESDSINGAVTDMTTAASEQILKWVTCQEPLTDEGWASYCDMLESYGLSDCVAVYQTAYDEYLAEFN